MQEHAFARPDSACNLCSFFVCVAAASAVAFAGTPLIRTEFMMSCATAAMLAALGTSGCPTVVVAVAVTVSVVRMRVVENAVVVDSALVVTVLDLSAIDRWFSGQ